MYSITRLKVLGNAMFIFEAVSRHVDLTSLCTPGRHAQLLKAQQALGCNWIKVDVDSCFQGKVSKPSAKIRQVTSWTDLYILLSVIKVQIRAHEEGCLLGI